MKPVLKVGVCLQPGFHEKCGLLNFEPRRNCPFPGVVPEIFKDVFAHAGFQYEPVLWNETKSTFGTLINGKWYGGLLELLQKSRIDTIASFTTQTAEREDTFSFSYPLVNKKTVVLSKAGQPTLGTSAWLLFEVFSALTWAFVCLSLLCGVIVLIIARMRAVSMNRTSMRMLIFVTGFSAMFLAGLYEDALLTQLSRNPTKKLFENFNQMAQMVEDGKLKMIFNSFGSSRYRLVMTSNHSFFQRLRRGFTGSSVVFEYDYRKIAQMLLTGQYAYMVHEGRKEFMIFNQTCGIKAMTDPFLPTHTAGMVFRKDFPWIAEINKSIIYLQQHTEIIIDKYKKMFNEIILDKCRRKSVVQPLNIFVLSGAFGLIFGVGFFGIIFLICERVQAKLQVWVEAILLDLFF